MEPTLEQLVDKINRDLNIALGKLIVPAMQSGIKEIREVHGDLLDIATDFDMLINTLIQQDVLKE